MSRTYHARGKARLLSRHRRNMKEWGNSAPWRRAERAFVDARQPRSPRRRSGDNWSPVKRDHISLVHNDCSLCYVLRQHGLPCTHVAT